MSRTSAGSMARSRAPANGHGATGSGGGVGAGVRGIGESKLLRTKHIDTLEVLEEYSREVTRLQKENKELQEQLIQLSGLGGGSLVSRLQSQENELTTQKEENAELLARIKRQEEEAEKQRAAYASLDALHRQTLSSLAATRAELDSLRSAHATCQSTSKALSERVEQLQRSKAEADERIRGLEKQVVDYQERIRAQETRLAGLKQIASKSASSHSDAASSGAQTPAASSKEKTNLAKMKDRLREKESTISSQHAELTALRARVSSMEERSGADAATISRLEESQRRMQSELTAAQTQTQTHVHAQSSSRSRVATANNERSARSELQRRRQEWTQERMQLMKEMEMLKKQVAELGEAEAAASRRLASSSTAESDLKAEVAYLESEVASLRKQLGAALQSNEQIRMEHKKASNALNKLMSSNGAGGSGMANTITVTSKKSAFPEYIALKRENELMQTQIQQLQATIDMLNRGLAQVQSGTGGSRKQSNAETGSSPSALARATKRAVTHDSNKSLTLIAAHESQHGSLITQAAAAPIVPATIGSRSSAAPTPTLDSRSSTSSLSSAQQSAAHAKASSQTRLRHNNTADGTANWPAPAHRKR